MLPWKLFFRFLSAIVLMATGGFAAGHDLPLPFTAPASSEVSAPAAGTTAVTTAPEADPGDSNPPSAEEEDAAATTTTEADDPAASTTTSTTAPAVVPVEAKAAPAPAPDATDTDADAPAVCAAAAQTACGPADNRTPDNTVSARVKRCQDWWTALAARLDANGRPEWADRARQVAGRCEALIQRWQERHDRWAQKGDHNHDGHPDDGKAPDRDRRDTRPSPEPRAGRVSRPSGIRH